MAFFIYYRIKDFAGVGRILSMLKEFSIGGALIGTGLGFAGGFLKGGLSDSKVENGKLISLVLASSLQGALGGPNGAFIGAVLGLLLELTPDTGTGSDALDVSNRATKEGILGCLSGAPSGILGCIIGGGTGIITGTIDEAIGQCTQN